MVKKVKMEAKLIIGLLDLELAQRMDWTSKLLLENTNQKIHDLLVLKLNSSTTSHLQWLEDKEIILRLQMNVNRFALNGVINVAQV